MKMYKYEIPVDDKPHRIDIRCRLFTDKLHVGGHPDQVDRVFLWAPHHPELPELPHWMCVYGTGQNVPDGAIYLGTALAPPFVWHLFQVGAP